MTAERWSDIMFTGLERRALGEDATLPGGRAAIASHGLAPPARRAFEPSFPLVDAKLHPPAAPPGTVQRDRLIRLLMAEPRPPIVSLVAPPGYGKTVLLTQWAAGEDRPVAWLTIDDFDNVPSVFLSYVAAAIDRIRPIDPSIRTQLAVPGSRILGAAVPRLAAELHRIGRPAVLVLDDIHRLVDPSCLDALAALLDHLPPGFQVALGARRAPALLLARPRAERALLEIAAEDLAFTPLEAEALAAACGRSFSPEDLDDLTERAEGWAAAMSLAMLPPRGVSPSAVVAEFTPAGEFVGDYLRSELLRDFEPDDVTFLTRSSILEVVEPRVAEAVVGSTGAAERLHRLAGMCQLIGEASPNRDAYRYHTLLREFLQAELERQEGGIAPALHARAAAQYAADDRPELAIEHALVGSDTDLAARLVTTTVLRTIFEGHFDRLQRWLRSFDDGAFQRYPPLAVAGAWVYALGGEPTAAGHLADIVERSSFTGPPGDGSASFESSRAMLLAALARRGLDDMQANAALAVEAEPPGSPWRAMALLMAGWARLLRGDVDGADRILEEAAEQDVQAGRMIALASRAAIAMERGEWRAATTYAGESRAILRDGDLGSLGPALGVHAVAARVAIHAGDMGRARDELVGAQLVRPIMTYAIPWIAIAARLELATAYLLRSDPAGARIVVAEAAAIAHRRRGMGILDASLAKMQGRLSRATGALSGASTLTAAELRLLPVLSTPLTFKEIGARFFISQHTVKTQAISIYSKLEASSRSEAVERAIELGLLEPFPGLPAARPARTS
jgi:LuxR family maltose regulon positive regulatory protein